MVTEGREGKITRSEGHDRDSQTKGNPSDQPGHKAEISGNIKTLGSYRKNPTYPPKPRRTLEENPRRKLGILDFLVLPLPGLMTR